jgi:transposase
MPTAPSQVPAASLPSAKSAKTPRKKASVGPPAAEQAVMPTVPSQVPAASLPSAKSAKTPRKKASVGPSAAEQAGVLGGSKGSRAELAGVAALDAPCALQPGAAAGDGRMGAAGGGSELRGGACDGDRAKAYERAVPSVQSEAHFFQSANLEQERSIPPASAKTSDTCVDDCHPICHKQTEGTIFPQLPEVADLSPAGFSTGTPTRSETQKTGAQERSAMRSVALDLGVNEISFCEVVGGKVVLRRTVRSLDALEDVLGPSAPPARVAIEACRESWAVHDKLSAWGNDVLLVDTTRSRQLGIGQHGRKTDRIDAECLALAVERGGIPLAHVLSPHRRAIRQQLSVRRALVETRAQYVTTVRGIVRTCGEKIARCETEVFLDVLSKASLQPGTCALIAPLVAALQTLNPQIALVDTALERLCAEEPVITRLTTVPGVGLIVAAAFVSVVDEATRFRDAHQLASYLGLVPLENTSGGRDKRRLGAITKQGNSYLRALLTQAAHTVMRQPSGDDPIRHWAHAVAKRRGRHIAVIALARRLSAVLWAMWRDGTVYDATAAAAASAKGLRVQAQSVELQAQAMKQAAIKARGRQRSINKGLGGAAVSPKSTPTTATRRVSTN